ncbi:MAG: universal stress protein [Sphingomonadaceae bacterium]
MALRSIFLFVPAESGAIWAGPPAYAVALARACGANLTAFAVALDVTTPGPAADPAAVADAIAEAARGAGVDCTVMTTHSHAVTVHEAISLHARLHDLVVIGTDDNSLLSERDLAEHLLFQSGRPVLLVPPSAESAAETARVAVAWDSSASAARALGDALALLPVETASFLTVTGEKDLPGGIEPAMVVEATGRRGVSASHAFAELGGRSIAAALQEEAQAGGASLLVMGAFAHSSLRRLVLGSATGGLLAELEMPVLLAR